MITGNIHSMETFGSVDGPGVRFVAFVQGCSMRCQFCHNADTWTTKENQIMTPEELLSKAWRYRAYWKNGGGITVSGGEPLMQIDFLLEFFRLAKEKGIHTTIDTAGTPFTREEPFFSKFQELMKVTDLLLVDIKQINPERHKALTGVANDNIIDMFRYLDDIDKPIWIRHVLVPEHTDFDEDLKKTREFIDTLHNVQKIEILPYHTLGTFKWKELGYDFKLEGIDRPSNERIENAKAILRADN